MPYEWSCDRCGWPNEPNATACRHCGFVPEAAGRAANRSHQTPWTSAVGAMLESDRFARFLPLALLVGAVVVGVLVGRYIAHDEIVVGDLGGLQAGFDFLVAGVILLVIVVVARQWIVALAAGLVLVGMVGGYMTYREPPAPVILVSPGTSSLELTAGTMSFSAPSGKVVCFSVPDGTPVAVVQSAADAGTLGAPAPYGPQGFDVGGGPLDWSLSLPAGGASKATIEFLIAGRVLEFDWFWPRWTGPVQVVQVAADGGSGRVTFDRLALEHGAEPPATKRSAFPSSAFSDAWPTTVSGTLSWTCPGPFVPGRRPTVY